MPYSGISDPSLPKDVQQASESQRKRFVAAFNSAFSDCDGDDCEGKAMAIARSAMKGKGMDTIEDYLKQLDQEYQDIKADIQAAPACEHCNAMLDETAKNLGGMQLCADCNEMLTKAVIRDNNDVLRKHYGKKGFFERLFGTKAESERGFKVLAGNKWVAWYTNARLDLEGEKFSYEGLQRDVKRQNDTGNYPELWFFHIAGTKHGKATNTFILKDMVVAVGKFDDTPIAEKFMRYYGKSTNIALSHGFVYDNAKFDGTTYQDFMTFEISSLPRGKEANPYTSFSLVEIKAMSKQELSEDQKQALIAALGNDDAQKVLDTAPDAFKAATKDLQGVIAYKADMMMDGEEDDEKEDGKKPPYKKSSDTEADTGTKADDIASKVIEALTPQFEAQKQSNDETAQAILSLHERLKQLEQSPRQKQMPRNPDIEALLTDQKMTDENAIQYPNETYKAVHNLMNRGNGQQQ